MKLPAWTASVTRPLLFFQDADEGIQRQNLQRNLTKEHFNATLKTVLYLISKPILWNKEEYNARKS